MRWGKTAVLWKSLALLWLILGSTSLFAQDHNGLIYQRLLQELTDEIGPVRQWHEQHETNFLPPASIDSNRQLVVRIGEPNVSYEKLEKKRFVRSIRLSLQIQDSSSQFRNLTHQDTLELRQLKTVFRQSPAALRGDKPTAWAKWGAPATLIGLSVGGVISLFYLRSQ